MWFIFENSCCIFILSQIIFNFKSFKFMKWISYNIFQNFPLFRIHRVRGDGGFVCIDISCCYQNLAALILIFTFLSNLLKRMVVAALCALLSNSAMVEGEASYSLRWSRNARIFGARNIGVRVYLYPLHFEQYWLNTRSHW